MSALEFANLLCRETKTRRASPRRRLLSALLRTASALPTKSARRRKPKLLRNVRQERRLPQRALLLLCAPATLHFTESESRAKDTLVRVLYSYSYLRRGRASGSLTWLPVCAIYVLPPEETEAFSGKGRPFFPAAEVCEETCVEADRTRESASSWGSRERWTFLLMWIFSVVEKEEDAPSTGWPDKERAWRKRPLAAWCLCCVCDSTDVVEMARTERRSSDPAQKTVVPGKAFSSAVYLVCESAQRNIPPRELLVSTYQPGSRRGGLGAVVLASLFVCVLRPVRHVGL